MRVLSAAGLVAACAAFALAVIGSTIMSETSSAQSSAKPVTTSSGLQIIDT